MEVFPTNLDLLRYVTGTFFALWLVYVNMKISRSELSFTLGLVWTAAIAFGLVLVFVPAILTLLSTLAGTQVPANLVFFGAILFLVLICFGLTLKAAKQQRILIVLTQELGLLRLELERYPRGEKGQDEPKRVNM